MNIYDYLTLDLYALGQNLQSGDSVPVTVAKQSSSETYSESIITGSIDGNLSIIGGFIQSSNFVSGTSGWRLSASGTLEAVNAILSGTIDIGGSDATSFHVDVDGNLWSGAATYASAPFKVSSDGVLAAISGSIGGFTVGATTITGGTLVLDSAGTIKTASSGQRVEISTTDIKLYDSGASVITLGTADLGAGATTAAQIALNSNSLTGMKITTSTDATLGVRMDSSSNVTFNAMRIELSNTGTGNDGYGIQITHAGGASSSYGIDVVKSGVGEAIRVNQTGTSDALSITVNSSTGGSAIDLSGGHSSRTTPLINITDLATSSSAPAIGISSDSSVVVSITNDNMNVGAIDLIHSSNSGSNVIGIRMNLANAGAGVEYAFDFEGSEYDGTKTGVSGLTGVIKVLTAADGLVYIPCYGTAT